MKPIDTITGNDQNKPEKADLKTEKIKKENILFKEISFSKKEKAGWSLSKKHKKEFAKKKRLESKVPQVGAGNLAAQEVEDKAKIKEKKLATVEKKEKKSWPKPVKLMAGTFAVLLLTLTFLILVGSASVFAYKQQFKDKTLFGTKILGQDVGGKNFLEVQQLITNRTEAVTIAFSVDGKNVTVKPAEAGVSFNPEATAASALQTGKEGAWYQPWLYSAGSLVYKISPTIAETIRPDLKENISVDYSIDDVKLTALTENLSRSFDVKSQNAGLVIKGTDVQVIPAIYGRKIITDSVKDQIAQALKSTQSATIGITVEKINPKIAEADTQKTITETQTILNTPITLRYEDLTFSPDKSVVGGWISFSTKNLDGAEQLVPVIVPGSVASYLNIMSKKINIPAVNKKVTIKNGGAQTVDREGKPGLAVDVKSASNTIANSLSAGRSVNLEIPTYAVKPKTEVNNVVVADWSKYIDVSIAGQKMCAWLAGGTPAFGEGASCWSITTAASGLGYRTPVGTHTIWKKTYVTSMPNPGGYPDPLTNIHYVSYFTQQYHAIHEAYWRSSFGGNPTWNGSHGCVNAPYWLAQKIYNWAPIGTPVIVH